MTVALTFSFVKHILQSNYKDDCLYLHSLLWNISYKVWLFVFTLTRLLTAFETPSTGRVRSGISCPASPSSWMITNRETFSQNKINIFNEWRMNDLWKKMELKTSMTKMPWKENRFRIFRISDWSSMQNGVMNSGSFDEIVLLVTL